MESGIPRALRQSVQVDPCGHRSLGNEVRGCRISQQIVGPCELGIVQGGAAIDAVPPAALELGLALRALNPRQVLSALRTKVHHPADW
jgi:hypothetical protein